LGGKHDKQIVHWDHTLVVQFIRAATYPVKFLNLLYFTFANFSPKDGHSDSYNFFLEALNCIPKKFCWEMFENGGIFGDIRIMLD
jgi:hypothetical protein